MDNFQRQDKVLIITQFFPPDYAATGQLIEELARDVGQQSSLDIKIFTGQPGYAFRTPKAPRQEQLDKIQVKRTRISQISLGPIRGKTINGVIFFLRATLHLLRHYYSQDLVVVTTAPPFLPLLGYLTHLFFRLSYVCIVYDLYPEVAIALRIVSKSHWLIKLWQRANRLTWHHAKGIVVLTPEMKDRLLAVCPELRDRITVIHSWADGDHIVPRPKQGNWFAEKYNLVDKFTVLYSGNMGRCHDMITIIHAAQYLQGQPIQFVLIGDGAQTLTLRQEVSRLQLTNIIFLPYQDRDVLPYSLTACDLSLITMAEGMEELIAPSKFYSTLAAGRAVAVICPQSSFLRKLVTKAKCGRSFHNGDSYNLALFISCLSHQPELSQSMGEAARQYFCANFTKEMASRKYLEVLLRSIHRK